MGDMRAVYELAARQHGVVNRHQLTDAGFGRSAIHRRVEGGEWLRLDHSVFALAASPPTWERQLSATVLSRPQAVVGHTSAGYLLGLRNCRPGRPVVVVPDGTNVRSGLARMIESDQFESLATTRVNGFSVTTVPETVLALAADRDPHQVEEIFDDALLSGRLDLDAMKAILDREAGRRQRGIRTIRSLVKLRLPSAPTTDSSYLEALLERVLSSAALPTWTREYPFALVGKPARVDVFIPEWALVVEADGRNWHLRRTDFENDRRRDNELASFGIQVLRYTYRMLSDEPERCRGEIVEVGHVRAAQRSA